jgi:competence protein ComEC
MVLTYLSIAWMAGIYLGSRVGLPLALWLLAGLLPLSVAWLWRRIPWARLAALCGLFLCLGAVRYVAAQPRFDESSVATYNDQGWVTLTGVIAAEPDVRDTYINLRVEAETLAVGDRAPMDIEGAVLVRAPRYPEHVYGERIEVRGELEAPPVFDTFSYRDYLARKGIYSLVRWARITVLARGEGNPLLGGLLTVKRHTQGLIAEVLPEPCAALLTGILLGVETGMPPDLAADFSTTGTSHIIAISGFNIAIISGLFTSLSVRLVGRRYAAWFSSAAIALYTLFVGASAAVVRAAVMGSIGVWGEHFGRQHSAPNALFATALLMTAWNPHTLWDLGFLLSFGATLGLIVLSDPLQRRFRDLLTHLLPASWVEPVAKRLDDALVLTTCAQLTTLPIIAYSFGTLSLVTLLSNVLILPAQQGVMLWGALAALGGLAWLPLGRVLGWVAWLFLAYTIWVVEWTADLPRAAIDLGSASAAAVVTWYVLLGAGAWWMTRTVERRRELWQTVRRTWASHAQTKALVGVLAVVALLVWLAVLSTPDGKLHVTFLDVGQGDAVLVETPSGRQIVVNGGPAGTTMAAHLGRRMPFWDRTLDLVVLTDLRDEHVVGLAPVVERYDVGFLWQPLSPDKASPAYEGLWAAAQDEGPDSQSPISGTKVDLGDGVILTVLYPAGDGGDGEDVLVLRMDYGQTCFLLAGSTDVDVEQRLLVQEEHLRCDVLQVGRHGGDGATSSRFLQAVRPALAVISCGEGNRAGDPDEAVMVRLAEYGATVARTDELGSIEVVSDGIEYVVRVGQ